MPGPIDVDFFRVRGKMDRAAMGEILASLPNGRMNVLIDRDSVVSELHIRSAFMHAARSILSGRSRARDSAMEVLRYVAGSRQVSEGVSIAGPKDATSVLIVASAPPDWPVTGDGEVLPEVRVDNLAGAAVASSLLEHLKGDVAWGGLKAAERILAGDPTGLDPELAVLERIALADMR